MKPMLIFIFLLFQFILMQSHAQEIPLPPSCQFKIPETIIFFDREMATKQLNLDQFDITHCDQKILGQLNNILLSTQGTLTKDELTFHLRTLGPVLIEGERINFVDVKSLIMNSQEIKPLSLVHLQIRPGQESYYLLPSNYSYEFSCLNCHELGDKQARLTIRDQKQRIIKTFLLDLTLKQKINVFVAKTYLRPFTESDIRNDFYIKEIETDSPERYLTENFPLHFYQLNRTIDKDRPLEFSSVVPKNLVRMGDQVKVILENKGLKIISMATARQSGHINDNISLTNENTKKMTSGKIIDYKTIRIEL